MTGGMEYATFEYIRSYLSVGIMTPERLCVKVSSSYFVFSKTGNSCRMLMMFVSVGQSTMAVNPSVALFRARVRSAGLVANMFVCSSAG